MDNLLSQFQESSSSGPFLQTSDQAKFKRLAIDAKVVIDSDLGHANDYSMNLIHAINSGSGGFIGGPSYACVNETVEMVKAASKRIKQRVAPVPPKGRGRVPYISAARISAIKALPKNQWDFSRLARLCEETNSAADAQCYFSIAMLVRAILDYVPPVFGYSSFNEVANNYGGKSLGKSLIHLQNSLRNTADRHLHTQIRKQESLPEENQVRFEQDIDALLEELIRISPA